MLSDFEVKQSEKGSSSSRECRNVSGNPVLHCWNPSSLKWHLTLTRSCEKTGSHHCHCSLQLTLMSCCPYHDSALFPRSSNPQQQLLITLLIVKALPSFKRSPFRYRGEEVFHPIAVWNAMAESVHKFLRFEHSLLFERLLSWGDIQMHSLTGPGAG